MGGIWLLDLPDVVDDAGLDWRVWPGWENRARSSGGYDHTWAIFAHHTASSASPDADCSYMWEGSPDGPIGAMLLDRAGRVTIGAAGATNTQGKGGPWSMSLGQIPLDKGNAYGIAVEAANNGTGEAWPTVQTDAYVILVAALCDYRGLDAHRDVLAHFEWVEPSCPGRKVDPVGPSPWATGAKSWNMDRFRDDVVHCHPDIPPAPIPLEDDMPALLVKANGGKSSGSLAVCDLALTSKRQIYQEDANALLGTGNYGKAIIAIRGEVFDGIPGEPTVDVRGDDQGNV